MLFVSSTLLLLVNVVTLRRDLNLFNRVAFSLLLFGAGLCLAWYVCEGIEEYLFQDFITYRFVSLLLVFIVLRLAVFYPRRLQEPIGVPRLLRTKRKGKISFLFN